MRNEMNKEKAIKIRSCFANGVDFKELETEETNILADALNEAIEKQIPKKPINDGTNIRYTPVYSCPKCDNRITGTGIASYCYHCGQKIDWE